MSGSLSHHSQRSHHSHQCRRSPDLNLQIINHPHLLDGDPLGAGLDTPVLP